jgi:hypothetical protein
MIKKSNRFEMNSEMNSGGSTPPRLLSEHTRLVVQQDENLPSCLPTWEPSNAWRDHRKQDAQLNTKTRIKTLKRRNAPKQNRSIPLEAQLMPIRAVSFTSRCESSPVDTTFEESLGSDSSSSKLYSISSLIQSPVDSREKRHFDSTEVMSPNELINVLATVNDTDHKKPGFLTTEKPPSLMIEELTDLLCHVNTFEDYEIKWDVVHDVVHRRAPTSEQHAKPLEHVEMLDESSFQSSFSSISMDSCITDQSLAFLIDS